MKYLYTLLARSSALLLICSEVVSVDLIAEIRSLYVSFRATIFHGFSLMNANSDSQFSTNEDSEQSSSEDSDSDSEPHAPEESNLRCMCGLPAMRRISRTSRNYLRPFFNCPKEISDQCRFFQWEDEFNIEDDGRHGGEPNSSCSKCHFLQRRISQIRYEMDDERAEWSREKTELEMQISTLKSELDNIKNRIKMANETELMPPLDKFSLSDDEPNDAVVKQMV